MSINSNAMSINSRQTSIVVFAFDEHGERILGNREENVYLLLNAYSVLEL